MPLTPHLVSAARPREKLYALTDGHGLCLQVTPEGSKRWRFRYRFTGLAKTISLGVYPKVGLAKARLLHADARGLLARGIDPSVERRQLRAANAHTFESVARSWLKVLQVRVHKHTLTATTVEKNLRLLERYIFPRIGLRPITAITPSELLVILKEIESHGFIETARRVKQRCSRVFRHAIGLGCLHCDITEGFRGLLERPRHQHRPSIRDPRRLGELLRAVDDFKGRPITGIALKLAPLLFVRPGELRHARWRHLDFANAQWRIPAECMKSRVQHLVPLSKQALALLKTLRPLSGDSEFLFPSTRSPRHPIRSQALSMALRSSGFLSTEVTPHGFRATACTLLNELGWNSDAIERQLAHGASDDLRRVYNYAQYLPTRRLMMQARANYLDKLRLSVQHERSNAKTSPSHPNTCPEWPTLTTVDRSPLLNSSNPPFLFGVTGHTIAKVHFSFETPEPYLRWENQGRDASREVPQKR
jgi:integrase